MTETHKSDVAKALFQELQARKGGPQSAGGAGLPSTQTITLQGTGGEELNLNISPNDAGELSTKIIETHTPLVDEALEELTSEEGALQLVSEGLEGIDVEGGPLALDSALSDVTEKGESKLDETMEKIVGKTGDFEGNIDIDDLEGEIIQDPDALAAFEEFNQAGAINDPEIEAIENAPDPFANTEGLTEKENKNQEFSHESEDEKLLEGVIEDFHPDGWMMNRLSFHLGLLHGPGTFFREDGSIQEKVHFVNGKLDGPFEQFDEEGCPVVRLNYKEGLLCGRAEFYAKGKLLTVVSYKDNKLDGAATAYNDGGEKTAEISFKEGYQTGPLMSYGEGGHLNARMNFYRGVLQGEWQCYHENGELLQEGSYNEGRKEGSFVSYYEAGRVSQVSHYANGKLIDPPMTFDKSGKEIDEY